MSDAPLTYADALAALAVQDAGAPDAVLARYKDGWRVVGVFGGMGPKVRASSYTVDPVEALKGLTAARSDSIDGRTEDAA